ncbi:MAG: substrate-binding domain-containing protein [Rhodospirillales bacterium]|nr:substrate-binding domain-containing protein [Rhodospirillales bacterium]MDH3968275.1 substrate-binding domain-containing protein [Rhodospirillales bacterium]
MPLVLRMRAWAVLPILAAAYLASPAAVQAETLTIGGTGAALGTMRALAERFVEQNPEARIDVLPSLGSGGGIRALLGGDLNIALSARPLKKTEREVGASELAYAQTPFVLVTSRRNVEAGLTRADLLEIYAGERISWPDATPIRLILRPESDTDWRILIAHMPGLADSLARSKHRRRLPVAYTEQETMGLAEKLAGSLATASLSAVIAEDRSLQPLVLDGVAPTVDNLSNGSYPLSKTFYAVVPNDPDQLTKRFIRFLASAEGARLLRRHGSLPLALPEGS